MEVGGSGWKWVEVGGSGWNWVEVGGSGWKWVEVGGSGWKCVSAPRFIQFSLGSCNTVHINALSIHCIMKVYIERNNMPVELIQFRKKYHLYSRLLLRSEEFNATDVFTLRKSLQHKPVR